MPDQQTKCREYPEERSEPFPEWVETAWRMYCRGQRNWTQLAKQFGVKDYRTVKTNVIKFGKVIRAAGSGSGVDAWQEALTAHEEVLSEAWRTHASADATPSEKLQALKVAQTSIEQIAVLNGVATKRSSVALGQDPDLAPVGGGALEQLCGAIARLAAGSATDSGTGDTDGSTGGGA